MSTRAVYTFKDRDYTFHVYKHYDGYPRGAAVFVQAALPYAWELPRFEASEFAAAFITANKKGNGNVYLIRHYDEAEDLDYRYEITCKRRKLFMTAFERGYGRDKQNCLRYDMIFKGTFDEFVNQYTHPAQ